MNGNSKGVSVQYLRVILKPCLWMPAGACPEPGRGASMTVGVLYEGFRHSRASLS